MFIDKNGDRKLITNPNAKLLTKDRSGLIGNDTEPDFSVWVEKIKGIKTVGEQAVVTDYEVNIDEKTGKELPQPKPKEPMITEKTGQDLFKAWDEMWSLSIEKLPEEKDSTGALKYTAEKSDPTRKKTMQTKFGVDSSTKLTEAQAKELIKSIKTKITELKKLPTPAKPETEATEPAAESETETAQSEAETINETPAEEAPATEAETEGNFGE